MSLITQFLTFGNTLIFGLGSIAGAMAALMYAKANPPGAASIEKDITAELSKLQSQATSTVKTEVKTVVSDVEAAVTKTPPAA
jgi:gas vesicle protein